MRFLPNPVPKQQQREVGGQPLAPTCGLPLTFDLLALAFGLPLLGVAREPRGGVRRGGRQRWTAPALHAVPVGGATGELRLATVSRLLPLPVAGLTHGHG